jgi:hypothetical protein
MLMIATCPGAGALQDSEKARYRPRLRSPGNVLDPFFNPAPRPSQGQRDAIA